MSTLATALDPLRHTAGYARYLLRKSARDREDAQVLSELESRTLSLPAGLQLEWLGTAGYRLTFQGVALLIDPFLSRIPLSTIVRRRTALPDPTVLDRYLPDPGNVAGIVVGHGHWDHALDAPEIARRAGCSVYGSRSVRNLMALHGLGDRSVVVEPYQRYELGPFTVNFVPSVHSKIPFGLAVPAPGDTCCESLAGLAPMAYGCGQTWGIHIEVAGIEIYHQGSADLVDDALRRHEVDIFLAGVAGRSVTPDYWRRILPKLRPATVVPMHYDDFLRPLDAPQGFTLDIGLAAVPEEIATVSRDIELAALPAIRPVS
ncbi:MBL fold metallo-hydrolase [Nocardia vermiculata]|uniref:MBL fold metallo-hydrolase n=1 Tax=Nocardia vermiculata TaxID=257274 RepID=A0A846XYF2_9NOCA|nr:MBL fold metallo-hydrolase [Nocardia vermiculata]NKY52113.1 MBL fold metallo-hydrolase [Nocardia vermiculata]